MKARSKILIGIFTLSAAATLPVLPVRTSGLIPGDTIAKADAALTSAHYKDFKLTSLKGDPLNDDAYHVVLTYGAVNPQGTSQNIAVKCQGPKFVFKNLVNFPRANEDGTHPVVPSWARCTL